MCVVCVWGVWVCVCVCQCQCVRQCALLTERLLLRSGAGYARVVTALLSFYYMPFDYFTASWLYMTSAFLDAWDGYAARYLGQSAWPVRRRCIG